MWILIVAFLAFFIAIVLTMDAVTGKAASAEKKTMTRLEQVAAPQSEAAESRLELRRVERLSGVQWLDDLLRRVDFSDQLKLLLYQADLNWTVGKLLLAAAALAFIASYAAYWRTGALLFSMLVFALAASAPFLYVMQVRARRFDRMRQYLPEALDLMVSAIRAGHSFASAMGMAAKEAPEPIKREFRQCFDEQNFGLELRFALENLAHRVPIHEIRIIVTALLIQAETGGNLTEILEQVAHLIREQFKIQRQVRVFTAQGRLTGWILSLLPPILGGLLYMINPEHMSLLWTDSTGRTILYASTVMTIVGALIIRKIVRIEV
jgi:tight adherence protein B